MKDSNSSIRRDIPDNWKINLRDHEGLDETLNDIIAQGTSFLSYIPPPFPVSRSLAALVSRIRDLLSDGNAGVAVLDFGSTLYDNIHLIDKAKLLIVMIGNHFGQSVTRNHLSDSPFFPVYHRKEGKGANYIGNALSNNQPGVHTDASAWRKARVDLLSLLSIRQAVSGGATIVVNALQVFDALPSEAQGFLSARSFIRQDPFDPQNPEPVRRTVYHDIDATFYKGLSIKYHRVRIEGGHKFLNERLNKEDTVMLNKLDDFLARPRFRHEFYLKSGHILFLNNNFICHDRTKFRDAPKMERYLERYWSGALY